MKVIGNNRFYPTQVEAEVKSDAPDGSRIIPTKRGFLVLERFEGLSETSGFAVGLKATHEKCGKVWQELS